MDRLLSMYEHSQNLQAKDMHHSRLLSDEFAVIVFAQLTKTDKEWVERIGNTIRTCDDHDCYRHMDQEIKNFMEKKNV